MNGLGCKGKDIITGVQGFIVGYAEYLYGCARIALEAGNTKLDERKAEWYDIQRIETIGKPKIEYKPRVTADVKLGSKVKDKVTGFEGIATGKIFWLSGNTDIAVEPTKLKDGKVIQAEPFDVERILVLEEMKPPMSKAAAKAPKIPGGPQNDPKKLR